MTINLGFDCCSKWTSVGVSEGDTILSEVNLNIGRRQSSCLPDAVQSVLRFAGCSLADVGRIVLTTGPGSFTGVRVGLSYGLTLAASLGCPVIPLDTLEAIALENRDNCARKTVAPILWAKRNFLYGAIYSTAPNDSGFTVPLQPAFLDIPTFRKNLLPYGRDILLLVERNRVFPGLEGLDFFKVPGFASGGNLALLGESLLARALPPEQVRGTYLRPPDIG